VVSDRLYEIFDAMLRDLITIRPDVRDVIWCPLCRKPFGRSTLDTGELTEEHIIPEALGGKIILKCCSNGAMVSCKPHKIRLPRHQTTARAWRSSFV
jgi:HNH endonuclease